MDKTGPIVLIDDDDDDLQLLIEIFADLNLRNEIHFFKNTASVISFLQRPEVNPFLIISDVNMPVMNGFELKRKFAADPVIRAKKIPYLFFSSNPNVIAISTDEMDAYQGIFRKPVKKSEWREMFNTIVKYWTYSDPTD